MELGIGNALFLERKSYMKKLKLILILLTTIGSFAFLAVGNVKATSIPSNYSFDYQKAGAVPYKAKSASQSAYLWNYRHTKRLHNIKNYPNSNWYVFYAKVKKYNNKRVVYYYVGASANFKIKGWIWSGYLTRLLAKSPADFKTESTFINYVKTDRSQRLARAILKLFPNTQLKLDLSKAAATSANWKPTLDPNYTNYINVNDLKPTGSTQVDSDIMWYLSKTAGKPITQRVNYVKRILNENGYTDEKRKSMDNYYIGIASFDGAQDSPQSYFTTPYPSIWLDDSENDSTLIYLATAK